MRSSSDQCVGQAILRPANQPSHVQARQAQRGFTLIELMISITLVAAISAGMLMAMRAGLLTLEKVDARLQSNRRVMSVEQILSRELGGVMPVTGQCGNAGGPLVPIFNGADAGLLLVSSYSMAEGARGYPRILQLAVVPSDRGGVRLIVNESLYTGPASTAPFCFEHAFAPPQLTPQTFVLADRLAYCHILYQEYLVQSPNQEQWLPVWNKPDLPSAVHVDMAPLVADAATLPLLSVTVPIHVTRQVMSPYVDSQ
jgi:prepilin-type N-terminal cleavage/methylation domain-containing protein